jgi:hypothetical protein
MGGGEGGRTTTIHTHFAGITRTANCRVPCAESTLVMGLDFLMQITSSGSPNGGGERSRVNPPKGSATGIGLLI